MDSRKDILQKIESPLTFAFRDHFKNLPQIKDLGKSLLHLLQKLKDLPSPEPPEDVRHRIDELMEIFADFDQQDPESKKIKIEQEKEDLKIKKEILREQNLLEQEIERENKRLERELKQYQDELRKHPDDKDIQDNVVYVMGKIKENDYRLANQRCGFVYCITNDAMPGMVKIGLSRRLDPSVRIEELSNASVPYKFKTHCIIFTLIDTLVLLRNLSASGPIIMENTGGINSNVVTKEIANEELAN